jgi:hypothetical protein
MTFLCQAILLFALRLALAIIGMPIVALALPWSYEVKGTRQANGWYMRRLPSWAWIWDNAQDGSEGDSSRRWLDRDVISSNAWLNRWWWLAVRNPVNNASRTWSIFSLSLTEVSSWTYAGNLNVRDLIGLTGWQFVTARVEERTYQGFYLVRQWGNSKRGLVMQIGYKIYPRELANPPANEGRVSFTFEISPFKDIG